jgi:hypothetical protein
MNELKKSKYKRGSQLICLETDEICVIHISGTDRQYVKFPDNHVGVYLNEQMDELFEVITNEYVQPKWIGLTEQEIDEIASTGATREACIHAAQNKLKAKNNEYSI